MSNPINGESKPLEMHEKRAAADAEAEQPAEKQGGPPLTPEELAKAAIVCEINITLFKDGNFALNGPFHDRILFEGSMAIATDAMRKQFEQLALQQIAKAKRLALPDHQVRKLVEQSRNRR